MKKGIAFVLAGGIAVVAGIFAASAFQVITVSDCSMLPRYEEGEHVLLDRWAYRRGKPQRQDIVVFTNDIYTMTGEGFLMTKRIIGIPGDRVMMTGESVYLNNRELRENYTFSESACEMKEKIVTAGKYFVLGDNRTDSTDSRNGTVDLVDKKDILGKVIYAW